MNVFTSRFGIFYHDTGTGKTCEIIKQITHFQKSVTNILVLIPNKTIIPQFQRNFSQICPPNINKTQPLNLFVTTLNEASSESFTMKKGTTVVFFDEAHAIKSVNLSLLINKLKTTNTMLKFHLLTQKFNITHAFALTATPMIDSPRELINILGSMAYLANVSIDSLPDLRVLNTIQNFEKKFEEILLWFRSKGGYLSRKKLLTNNYAFPVKNVSQSYFDPYTHVNTKPLEIVTDKISKYENLSTRKNISRISFNQTKTLAWSNKSQNAIHVSLEDKLPVILDMCQKYNDKSPVLIYSKFKDKGVLPIATYLANNGITNMVVLTGDSSSKEIQEKMNMYNDPTNYNGSLISVMLITARMATGYNFRNTQLMILTEPDYNPGVLQQAMGRVIRRKIFDNVHGRGSTKIIGLLSVSPNKTQMTIDQQMHELMMYKLNYMKQASLVFDKVSVESIGLEKNPNTSTRDKNKFNLKAALKHNLKLKNENLKNYPKAIRLLFNAKLQEIKKLTANVNIINKANVEYSKLNACLSALNFPGNNPLQQRNKVCNLKKIYNQLKYMKQKAEMRNPNPRKPRSKTMKVV